MSTFALTTKNNIVIFGVALTIIVSTITFLIDAGGQVRLQASRLQLDAINRPSTSLVVFTSQNFKSGDAIKSDSVELKLVKSEDIPQDAIWNPEMVLGKTTKRALLKGVLLSTQDISDLNPKNAIDFGIKDWPKLRYWAFDKNKNLYLINFTTNDIEELSNIGKRSIFCSGPELIGLTTLTIDDDNNLYGANYINGVIVKIGTDRKTRVIAKGFYRPYFLQWENDLLVLKDQKLTEKIYIKLKGDGVKSDSRSLKIRGR